MPQSNKLTVNNVHLIMVFKKIWNYLTFKREKDSPSNFNLKMMHGINKISLFMFLVAIIVMLFRFCK
jgi:hypothetical protein